MLIPSKLSRPSRLEHTVVRERLLAKLSGANNYRLALVTSPAGYGKTTLVSQWASGKHDLGWFSLDEGDNQQERFASYLIAADSTGDRRPLRRQRKPWCKSASTPACRRCLRSCLLSLPTGSVRCTLVIDDYHLITNPVIHDAMRFFLRHQPETMTLVVLSRNLPQLGDRQPTGARAVTGNRQPTVGFTHQEAKQFFDCRLAPIEADDSSRLCDDVAGWATALQLIALSARQKNTSAQHSARRLAGINASHLSDYLVDEVLDNVDARTRSFLLKARCCAR